MQTRAAETFIKLNMTKGVSFSRIEQNAATTSRKKYNRNIDVCSEFEEVTLYVNSMFVSVLD